MDNNKQQLITRLKDANNVLVTVSKNPSVDQLAAALGLTLALNRLKKHATAVFSGTAPSVMEFLEPDKTFEKNTDSLRDFIISLDRSKADKLRYKVEDTHVRIYISPYRTSIHKDDLQFSQGEANVDIVVALGVHEQVDLDQAIVAHGKILHDATIATVNAAEGGTVGSIDWVDTSASSISEMIAQLSMELTGEKGVDDRIATALLTGLVSETERFSNEKTKPTTLSLASRLMEAGANQQLVSEKLQPPPPPPPPPPEQPQADPQVPSQLPEVPAYSEAEVQQPAAPVPAVEEPPQEETSEDDGTLHINHEEFEDEAKEDDGVGAQIHIDDHGNFYPYDQGMVQDTPAPHSSATSHQQSSVPQDSSLPPIIKKPQSAMLPEQPSTAQDEGIGFGGTATDAEDEAFFDPLSASSKRNEKILQHEGESGARDSEQQPGRTDNDERHPASRAAPPPPSASSEPKASAPLAGPSRTLEDIERSVGAHQQANANQAEPSSQPAPPPPPPPELDGARQAIIDAMNTQSESQTRPPEQPKVQNPQQPPPVPPPMMPPQQ